MKLLNLLLVLMSVACLILIGIILTRWSSDPKEFTTQGLGVETSTLVPYA